MGFGARGGGFVQIKPPSPVGVAVQYPGQPALDVTAAVGVAPVAPTPALDAPAPTLTVA